MSLPAEIIVTVGELTEGGYEVVIEDGSRDEFARVFCGDLQRALGMALPYMACLCVEPDPLEAA